MKKLLIISSVLCSVFFFSCKENKTADSSVKHNFTTNLTSDSIADMTLPLAFVNTDSLLTKYEFAKREDERLKRKQDDSRLSLTRQFQQFEKDAMDYQQKVQYGVYSAERKQEEEARLMRKRQELQNLEEKLSDELMAEQQKVNLQLKDSLDLALKLYNADRGIHIIFSNNGIVNTVLLADDKYDITNDVVELMNSRFKAK